MTKESESKKSPNKVKALCLVLFVALYAAGNRIRGGGKVLGLTVKKVIVYAVWGLATAAALYLLGVTDWKVISMWGAEEFLTAYLGFSVGWGKFFPHGNNISSTTNEPIYEEDEFFLAEWTANFFVGKWDKEMPYKFVRNWQTVAMMARLFFVLGIPKAAAIFYLTQSYLLVVFTLVTSIVMGYIYRVCFTKHTGRSGENAEILSGAVLGCLTVAIIWRVANNGWF